MHMYIPWLKPQSTNKNSCVTALSTPCKSLVEWIVFLSGHLEGVVFIGDGISTLYLIISLSITYIIWYHMLLYGNYIVFLWFMTILSLELYYIIYSYIYIYILPDYPWYSLLYIYITIYYLRDLHMYI